MENDNKKFLVISYVALAALAAFVMSLLFHTFSASSDLIARLTANELVRHGVPLLIGFGVFAALQFNPKVSVFGEEVITEVKKVVWPSRKDTFAMTIVVCVMVITAGIFLGLVDYLSLYLVNDFLPEAVKKVFG